HRRRLRREQSELERRLIRMLHREPAIIAVRGIGVHPEAELLDVELQRFVLIANVQAGHSDTLGHGTSNCFDPCSLPASSRRRFSETAIVRAGRWAALTKQCG